MYQSDVAPLRRVLLRHPRDAFIGDHRIDAQWRDLHYLGRPDFSAACREADAFAALLEESGVVVEWMAGGDLGLDSLYVRDASVVGNSGAILCRMGKPARRDEPAAQGAEFAELGIHVAGAIGGEGRLEGGDVTWLSPELLAVGQGYRTNAEGIRQLADLAGDEVEVLKVGLPHWTGVNDVMHLMSLVSPLAEDLLLVYSRLLPVPFREELLRRGFELVEVPDSEWESQGCNVLAVAPRVAIALEGNPETRRRMEAAGVTVRTFSGEHISTLGCGGPTCLTRPLEREVS